MQNRTGFLAGGLAGWRAGWWRAGGRSHGTGPIFFPSMRQRNDLSAARLLLKDMRRANVRYLQIPRAL